MKLKTPKDIAEIPGLVLDSEQYLVALNASKIAYAAIRDALREHEDVTFTGRGLADVIDAALFSNPAAKEKS